MQRQTRIGMQAECNRCGRHREPVFHIPLYVRITHVHAPPRRCLPTPITGPHWLTHTAMPPPCAWSGRNGEYMHKKYRSARTSGWAVVTARFDMRILPKLNTNAHACEHLQGPHASPSWPFIAMYNSIKVSAIMATTYRIQPPALSYTLGTMRRLSPRWLSIYSLPHEGVHVQIGAPPRVAPCPMPPRALRRSHATKCGTPRPSHPTRR